MHIHFTQGYSTLILCTMLSMAGKQVSSAEIQSHFHYSDLNDSLLKTTVSIKGDLYFWSLMGEGFILLTRGYGFMEGMYHLPFDTLKIGTSTGDIKLKLYR